MLTRRTRRPDPGSPQQEAVIVDDFPVMLAALTHPTPWEPASGTDVAVRLGTMVERGHPRPGDDTGPSIVLALTHPDDGNPLGNGRHGWRLCEADLIVGQWNPAYRPLTHIGSGQPFLGDALPPAHYAVHITRPGIEEPVRVGMFTQAHLANTVAWQLISLLPHAEVTTAVFDMDQREQYVDPSNLPDVLDALWPGSTLTVRDR